MADPVRVHRLAPGLLHVHLVGQAADSALVRYGFVRDEWPEARVLSPGESDGVLALEQDAEGRLNLRANGQELLRELAPAATDGGFRTRFALPAGLRFYGLGDQTRERLQHRGTKASLWIRNVSGYIPIPFLWTTGGYGLLVNTTRRLTFDLGATSEEWFGFACEGGELDYYVLYGPTPREIIGRYTELTGRPPLWPKWSLGLTFVCRTQANDREFLDDCAAFRREGIPCDAISLEPGWMKQNYDYAVTKEWHPERFPIPPYAKYGPYNFLDAARRMGYKPGLWLCNDYDLSWEEERLWRCDHPELDDEAADGGFEADEHLTQARRMDTLTRPDEPWYRHLSEFVKQGVAWFKQDGANQVLDHPDRLWANGMRDDEMHNLYPLCYSRQMYEGFRQQTGRRPFTFTPAGWAGLQRWTATWTGDTGGGEGPLGACLNLSLSGHGMSTPDMDVTTPAGIHFGFLLPWSQLNSWNYFRHPWYQGEELCRIFREYARLRYRLLPYLYSAAWEAHQTGWPMLRALPLEYPGEPEAERRTQYLLGPSLLVGAFTEELWVPPGEWVDFWTGARYTGPSLFRPEVPADRGGPLLVRAGAILPNGPDLNYVGEKPDDELTLHVCAGPPSEFVLYEDDGWSLAHEQGSFRTTRLSQVTAGDQVTLTIAPAEGEYDEAPTARKLALVVYGAGAPVRVDLGVRSVDEAITEVVRLG